MSSVQLEIQHWDMEILFVRVLRFAETQEVANSFYTIQMMESALKRILQLKIVILSRVLITTFTKMLALCQLTVLLKVVVVTI